MKTRIKYSDLRRVGLVRSASFILLAAIVAGCSGDKETPQATASGKIVIRGSNTIGEELGPRLVAEYKKSHPGVVISLEAKSTGAGIWGLIGGACDIAAASRTLKDDERTQAQARGIALKDAVIGTYSVAVIVHPGNPVTNLTREQVRDFFTGAVQNWKEVGGPDAPVHLYIRDLVSGTYLGFRELAMEDKSYATNNVTAFNNYAAIAEAVTKDQNGIGYSTIQLANKPGVKAISIGGVPASMASVKEGKYPYMRLLHLYTSKATEGLEARGFVQFVQSSQGQEILEQMGFVPSR